MHISQAIIAAGVVEGEAFVIEAEEMQDGGLQIMNVHGPLGDVEAQFIGGAKGEAAFNTTAGEPEAEGLRMVIAAELAVERGVALDHWRAAKFPAPDHQGILQ